MAFVTNPIKIIAAWEGGMSFHGGLLGVVIAVWLFCRRQKLQLSAHRRSGLRLRADGPVLRPHRQFREWRIVGPASPTCPGRWCFPAPATCRAIPASFTKRRWKAFCCSSIVQICLRVFRCTDRPGLIIGDLLPGLWHLPLHLRILPRARRAVPGAGQHGHGAVDSRLAGGGRAVRHRLRRPKTA